MTPLYKEEVHMLEGLDDEELENYMEENPWIVPLFEIYVIEAVGACVTLAIIEEEDCKQHVEAFMEFSRA